MAVRVLFLISILFGVVKGQAMVHDIAVKNADSVTIYYNYINDGKELEVTGQGYIGSVVIPEEVTYQNITRKVTSIEDYALSCCHHLKSVTIPRSVTSIGARAFEFCDRLASISVEVGNKVYDSRDNCNAIIETATNTLIAGCKNTVIPKSVTSIGRGAFSHCNCLTSLTIPKGVTSIGIGAFDYCTRLKSVKIPRSVTSIGAYAFYGCYSLKDVYCYAVNVPTTDSQPDGDWVFCNLGSVKLHVPAASLEAYKTAWPWKVFGKFVELR